MDVSRLFDIPYNQLKQFPNEDCVAAKENGVWKKYSTQDVIDMAGKVSRCILAHDLKPDDKIAIISNNRPEWVMMDLGMLQVKVVNVPIYPTISTEEFKFIFNDAQVKLIFVSDQDLFDKVHSIQNEVPSLKALYTFDQVKGANHWTKFLENDKPDLQVKVDEIKATIKEHDLATIIYTSGTTGVPKGVMLTHHNIISNVKACIPYLPVNHQHKALSFLPLNHSFERMITYLYLSGGVSIYYAESMETIGDNMREVNPHIFTAVPRLLEKVYDKILAKGLDLKGIKKALFFWALNLGLKYELNKKNGWWYHFRLGIANKLIFNKWRDALGGNVICMVSGSAALQPRLARVFTAAQIPVLEGYGLTETSPVISVNRFEEELRYFGSVGPVIDGVEVKIATDGEILCKGPNVMKGYYKRDDLTQEVIDQEGWFHTGDIGEFVEGKFLKITDRKKEIFKTSGGKYCAPQPIENKFKESFLIEQIMVVGENQKFVGALIVPAFANLEEWCKDHDIPYTSKEEAIKDERILKRYAQILNEYNPVFSHVEQIKKFKLVPQEWTIESGELTPTMKLKRKAVAKKYQDLIDAIYD